VSRASADQRRGRAGRTEPGVAYRLWDEAQTASLEQYARPEILSADLSSFVLDLAAWGAAPETLAFLDPPPKGALTEAGALLTELGALENGRITAEGHALRRLPLPPRLARMVLDAAREGAGALAADIAAALTERGLGGDDPDLTHRVENFRRDRSPRARDARAMARRWAELSGGGEGEMSVGSLLALAYPDRIAKNRGNGAFTLVNGRGGNVDQISPLSREPFIAVAELTGSASNARIVLAAPISFDQIEARFSDQIEIRDEITFDEKTMSLRGRRTRRLGAIVLSERTRRVEPDEESARVLAQGIRRVGIDKLFWTKSMQQWRDRVMFLRRATDLGSTRDRHSTLAKSATADLGGDEWPDLSDAALAASLEDWLGPVLELKTVVDDIHPDELDNALSQLLPWPMRRRLDDEAPTHFQAPTDTRVPIDYEAEAGPTISIRLQELFGLAEHPTIAGGRIPLVIELLSPAHRPVQVTRDLPGFWRGSYAAVRREMRGRYPRHPWPDDPLTAAPTRRVKPRGT
jgi:ATP-dependent helicase HrpB